MSEDTRNIVEIKDTVVRNETKLDNVYKKLDDVCTRLDDQQDFMQKNRSMINTNKTKILATWLSFSAVGIGIIAMTINYIVG